MTFTKPSSSLHNSRRNCVPTVIHPQPSQEPAGGLPSDWHSGLQLGQPQQEPRKSTPTPQPRVSGWPTRWQSHLQPTPPPPQPSFHQQKPQPQQFVPIQRLRQPVQPPSVPSQQVQPEVIEINSDEELEPVAEPVVPVPLFLTKGGSEAFASTTSSSFCFGRHVLCSHIKFCNAFCQCTFIHSTS